MVKPRPRGSRQDRLIKRGATEPPASPRGADGGADVDAEMFRAAVGDVRPLPPTGRASDLARVARKARTRGVAAGRARKGPVHELGLIPDSATPYEAGPDVVSGSDPLSFRRPGVRDQVVRRLRRGLYPIEDVLDLHGLNQAAARDTLSEFLNYSREAGRRCLKIVHGKGYRSGARGPILKIAVNDWLRRHPDIMAFTSARAIDGGTGAVYVLLRA